MAVTYSNQIENHRGIYFEVTGDGATTALTVNHNRGMHSSPTGVGFVTTAGSTFERTSGKGGHVYPANGTSATVSSTTVTSSAVTVNTSSAVGNGTKAYVVVVFDKYTT